MLGGGHLLQLTIDHYTPSTADQSPMPDDLRYPIGKPEKPATVTDAHRRQWIGEIAAAPSLLRAAVGGLSDEQLDTPYRPGGWTVRQVIHHVPDSHLNAYIRFRWALTEDDPLIKAYNEKDWAELPDARTAPVEVSLALLDAVHARWMALLTTLSASDGARTLQHPEYGPMTVDDLLALYAWHGRHHAAHITALRARNGW